MSFPMHSVDVVDGSTTSRTDRLVLAVLPAQANAAGGGAGASVATAISGLTLPSSYLVQVTPSQDAVAYVSSKTTSGFTVTLTPRLAANTLASGTFDVVVFG